MPDGETVRFLSDFTRNAVFNSNTQSTVNVSVAKAGEPFPVQCLLFNDGSDGVTTARIYVDGELAGEKIMAVNGGSWRIVQMDLVIDEVGEHEITVGDITKTLVVE